MHYVEFPLQKASFNLALEEALFEAMPAEHPGYFILWQNLPSAIIGRNQILQEEINLNFARTHQIPVIRRNTGGGAVYHDEGNLNYSFLINATKAKANNYTYFLEQIVIALKQVGIDASTNGRNDLELHGRKFSGTSQLRNSDKLLHHGTLLFNVNFDNLKNILHVDERKYKSKGIASLRSRVTNICEFVDIGLEELKSALISQFSSTKAKLSDEIVLKAQELMRNKYESATWNYEKSPSCTLEKRKRFVWGELIIQLDIRGGRIKGFVLRGDIINLQSLEAVQDKFTDVLFLPDTLSPICESISWEEYILGSKNDEIRDFICKELFD